MFYASVIPVLIGGLVDGLALTKSQAGYVASANVYGSACGALLAVFFVKRFSWRPWVSGALLMLMSLDFISTDITALNVLVVVRFVAGVVGGIVTGFAFALIARTKQPDRGFGALIFWQFGLSGLVFLVLPPLMASVGYQLLFFVLVGFSALTLTLLPLLAHYPVQSAAERASSARLAVTFVPLVLVLVSIFLYQAAFMGVFAYVERLGVSAQLERDWIGLSLAVGT